MLRAYLAYFTRARWLPTGGLAPPVTWVELTVDFEVSTGIAISVAPALGGSRAGPGGRRQIPSRSLAARGRALKVLLREAERLVGAIKKHAVYFAAPNARLLARVTD